MTSKEAYIIAYFKEVEGLKRAPELEDIIMNNTTHCFCYARDVIRGKLPDKMHNKMLLYAMEDPSNYDVKSYFKLINK